MWTLLVGALSVGLALAAPSGITPRTNPTPVTASTVASFKPYTFFASAAYCSASETINWSCGGFVGFYPPLNSVVVAHQGTDPDEIFALVTDVEFFLGSLNATLFPGVSSSVEVHDGFRDEQASTAPLILSAVQQTLAAHGTSQVVLSGHSLGAALTLLDALFLSLHLSASVSIKVVNFGMPRVGNQAFANLIDARIPDLTHIGNMEDPVPTLPGRFLGYVNPSGEIHIEDSGQWVSCAGQDDTAQGCEIASVPNIFESDLSDHDGPYNGVEMGC